LNRVRRVVGENELCIFFSVFQDSQFSRMIYNLKSMSEVKHPIKRNIATLSWVSWIVNVIKRSQIDYLKREWVREGPNKKFLLSMLPSIQFGIHSRSTHAQNSNKHSQDIQRYKIKRTKKSVANRDDEEAQTTIFDNILTNSKQRGTKDCHSSSNKIEWDLWNENISKNAASYLKRNLGRLTYYTAKKRVAAWEMAWREKKDQVDQISRVSVK
jgi:hypothetical protein